MLWGLLWRSKNKLDGLCEHLIYTQECCPKFFTTRKSAQRYAKELYGYIKERKDLRQEPHGWRMLRPVKIKEIKWFKERG